MSSWPILIGNIFRLLKTLFDCRLSNKGISSLQGAHHVAQKLSIISFPLQSCRLILLPEKSSNITGETDFGISFITILLSGTSSLVCDIDEKILKLEQAFAESQQNEQAKKLMIMSESKKNLMNVQKYFPWKEVPLGQKQEE